LRLPRFHILGRDAVVADFGAGHRHDLSRVRRIGQDFLVAGHAGVEHDLASRFSFGAGGLAAKERAIFES
jgi:hypothetical protein